MDPSCVHITIQSHAGDQHIDYYIDARLIHLVISLWHGITMSWNVVAYLMIHYG